MGVQLLNGIKNFLSFINDNWVMITTIIGLFLMVLKKACDFIDLTQEEKVKIAKAQIKVIMLRLVTEAEKDYREWVKAGEIKRAQVIDEIFAMYPVLSKVADQDKVIAWIDDTIVEALKKMRKIIEDNNDPEAVACNGQVALAKLNMER